MPPHASPLASIFHAIFLPSPAIPPRFQVAFDTGAAMKLALAGALRRQAALHEAQARLSQAEEAAEECGAMARAQKSRLKHMSKSKGNSEQAERAAAESQAAAVAAALEALHAKGDLAALESMGTRWRVESRVALGSPGDLAWLAEQAEHFQALREEGTIVPPSPPAVTPAARPAPRSSAHHPAAKASAVSRYQMKSLVPLLLREGEHATTMAGVEMHLPGFQTSMPEASVVFSLIDLERRILDLDESTLQYWQLPGR